jgi:ATP-binding cassette, subfamily B (MDR/TAP), member 1
MAVFWACLIATSNLQMCIPQFIIFAKRKFAVVALLSLVDNPHSNNTTASAPALAATSFGYTPSSHSVLSHERPFTSTPIYLRKIIPQKHCTGEFALSSISISYPTRPSIPVLAGISLFLPAHELTFIVGSSRPGKSPIVQLLLEMYQHQGGTVLLDVDVRHGNATSHDAGEPIKFSVQGFYWKGGFCISLC